MVGHRITLKKYENCYSIPNICNSESYSPAKPQIPERAPLALYKCWFRYVVSTTRVDIVFPLLYVVNYIQPDEMKNLRRSLKSSSVVSERSYRTTVLEFSIFVPVAVAG